MKKAISFGLFFGLIFFVVLVASATVDVLPNNPHITVNNEVHSVKVSDRDTSSVDLTITSSLIEISLVVGEVNKIDLNSDNIFDLQIKLNSIVNNAANLTFKLINETITLAHPPLLEKEEKSKEEAKIEEEEQPKAKEKPSKPRISEEWTEYTPEKKSELLPFIKNIAAKAKNLILCLVRIPYAKYIGTGIVLLIIILLVFPQLRHSKKNNKTKNKNKRNKQKSLRDKIADFFFE